MLPLLFVLIASLQAATLKVECTDGSLLVLINGSNVGRTPIVLDLDDGRHAMEFKREEWQVSAVTYGLLVNGQTRGKMLVDWDSEEIKVVWAEDIIAARQAEQDRIEAEKRAEQDRIEAERRYEEEARQAEEQRIRDAEEQKRIMEEEAQRAAARERYMPHREEGVAAMKSGDRRTALRAFRESQAAGDDDKRIIALVTKLEGEMGSVRAKVSGAKSGVPIELTLDTPEAEPFAPDSESRSRWTFEDVPVGVPLELRVSGPGYPSVVVEIEPLEAGQRKDATAALSYFGNATLVLTDFPGDIRVTVTDPAAEHNPQEAGELAVTAGALTIALDGPSGSRELSVELADGTSEVFAVKDKMPGAVVLEGLPAGTVIHLVEGPEGSALSSAGTARDDIREVQAGVGISAPLRLDSLLPGDHELSLVHPVLGSTTMRFAPLPGETDHRSILWETMSNATQVKAARQDWEQRHAASKQVPKATKLALATAGGTAALAAGTAVVGAMAMGTRSDLKGNDTDYTMALNSDDGEAAWSLYSDQVDLKRSLRTTGPIALGGLGITAAGAGVTVVLFGRGRAERKPVADWDLWSLPSAQVLPELPVPQPADTPADTPVED